MVSRRTKRRLSRGLKMGIKFGRKHLPGVVKAYRKKGRKGVAQMVKRGVVGELGKLLM